MGKKIQKNIVNKLRVLYNIQLIDTRIDEIQKFRQNIPIEISILEKELIVFQKKLENLQKDIFFLKENILKKNKEIKSSYIFIQKYENKKNNIRNNKELYTIDKEIDYKKLEIQLYQKKIKEININIKNNENYLKKEEEIFKNKKEHLFHKKKELNQILLDNEKEEKILRKKYLLFFKKIDNKLLKIYQKIRHVVKNGVAIAPVQRGAPLGSYLAITPQKYSELIQRNKIVIDEHSGRILIDGELAEEEKKKYFMFCSKKKKK